MGKLILAIIVVAFFQIAFVVYIATDVPADIAATVAGPGIDDTSVDTAWMNDLDMTPETAVPATASVSPPAESRPRKVDALAVNDRRPGGARPNAVERGQRSLHQRPVRRAERYVTYARSETRNRNEFRDTIIYYNANRAVSKPNREIPRERVAYVPKTKKRSFIAKALPILKKPWDLIKGIASRLD